MRSIPLAVPALLALLFAPSSCSRMYYGTMEKLGYDKREILVDRVEEARDDQEAAKEQFKTTLERFKEVTGNKIEGEDAYNALNSEYEECEDRVATVKKRIASVEDVSEAMFAEWDTEIGEMTTADLKAKSTELRRQSMQRYNELHSAMKSAESKMEPVLAAFKERVLFLKHNLNAQAIASLQGTVVQIEGDVNGLITQMEQAIAKANAFIDGMHQSS